ncbi:MAG: SpoIIIAH-like family protein [Lachnospiraceae bacterium]|nr:SpoIIIAH-like family protein [Lachnospiraceae bacterium]MBP3570184.1 SpoIIIAH-like family protein [Lachnospiraceae bacterium]
MKKLFKKNQVIITALALMICAAGYLQFSDAGEEADSLGAKDGYEYNVSENEGTGTEEADGITINVGNMDDGSSIAEDVTVTGKSEEVADSQGNDAEGDSHQIGEAVMVSTTLQGNFTTNARLVREQRRAQSKETLMGIIDNASLSEEQKQEAVETLVNLTTIAEKENAAELLLEAKGFADPIVNISENEVDVVINAISVTDQQIAQIEDIVTRKTGYEVEDITITAAIQED